MAIPCFNCETEEDVSTVPVDTPDGGLTSAELCPECAEKAGVSGYV